MQAWIARVSTPLLRPLHVVNVALADEGLVTASIPLIAIGWFIAGNRWRGIVVMIALIASPRIEEWLKGLAMRGRPRDPHEWGLPSGDCALVTIWTAPLVGWWAAVPIGIVAWARVARDAHFPLDVIAGIGLGLWLVSPALLGR